MIFAMLFVIAFILLITFGLMYQWKKDNAPLWKYLIAGTISAGLMYGLILLVSVFSGIQC